MAKDSIWKQWEFMAIVFVVVIALVIASGYAAYGAFSTSQDPAESGLKVQIGDQISVNYIGMFEDGTVFDTSIQSVAENNTLYPKSLSFSSSAPFNPLPFTVGENLIQIRDLTDTFPVFEWITNISSFQSLYQVSPIIGTTVTSNDYGWKMTVFYIDPVSNHIMLKHEPMAGEIISINNVVFKKINISMGVRKAKSDSHPCTK